MEPHHEKFGDSARLVRIKNSADPVSYELGELIEKQRQLVLDQLREEEEQKQFGMRSRRPFNPAQRLLQDLSNQPANRGMMEEWEAWVQERKADLDRKKTSTAPPKPRFDLDFPTQRSPGEGELWWAETNWILPDRLGLTLFWDDQGVRLSGRLEHSSGNLWKGSLVVFSWFGLTRDRMPGGSTTRFRSTPWGLIQGEVAGFTGGGSIFNGDQWSKCWLQASQVVHQGSQSFPALAQPWTLLFMEDDLEHRTNFLPGNFPFPSIDFDLNRQLEVHVFTGLRFDFQLEGDVEFRFGGIGHMNPSLFRGANWRLQRL